jgi:hypothetical protein
MYTTPLVLSAPQDQSLLCNLNVPTEPVQEESVVNRRVYDTIQMVVMEHLIVILEIFA